MKQNIILSIPQPCHENWNKMSPVEKGRFCDSCQKKVFDFTADSDRQILERIKNEENLCGRFLPSQLERKLVDSSKSPHYLAAAAGFVSMLALGANSVNAQTTRGEVVRTFETQTPAETQVMGKMLAQPQSEKIIISGKTIADTFVIPGVLISIDGNIINGQSDIEGNFSISCYPGSTLYFSFFGYEKEVYVVPEKNTEPIEIVFDQIDKVLYSEIYMVGGLTIVKESAPKRWFRKIKNWFR